MIDDDRVTARFVTSLLTTEGYDVIVAEDGEHAMKMAVEHRPVQRSDARNMFKNFQKRGRLTDELLILRFTHFINLNLM